MIVLEYQEGQEYTTEGEPVATFSTMEIAEDALKSIADFLGLEHGDINCGELKTDNGVFVLNDMRRLPMDPGPDGIERMLLETGALEVDTYLDPEQYPDLAEADDD
jgi:hypothetical protein